MHIHAYMHTHMQMHIHMHIHMRHAACAHGVSMANVFHATACAWRTSSCWGLACTLMKPIDENAVCMVVNDFGFDCNPREGGAMTSPVFGSFTNPSGPTM